MGYCGCEDYPCCGHDADMGPESAEEFLDGLDDEEYEFAMNHMVPCTNCGEMRPKDDPVIRRTGGVCHMCTEDPVRGDSPVADANFRYFVEQRDQDAERIRQLEEDNKELLERIRQYEHEEFMRNL